MAINGNDTAQAALSPTKTVRKPRGTQKQQQSQSQPPLQPQSQLQTQPQIVQTHQQAHQNNNQTLLQSELFNNTKRLTST